MRPGPLPGSRRPTSPHRGGPTSPHRRGPIPSVRSPAASGVTVRQADRQPPCGGHGPSGRSSAAVRGSRPVRPIAGRLGGHNPSHPSRGLGVWWKGARKGPKAVTHAVPPRARGGLWPLARVEIPPSVGDVSAAAALVLLDPCDSPWRSAVCVTPAGMGAKVGSSGRQSRFWVAKWERVGYRGARICRDPGGRAPPTQPPGFQLRPGE